MAEEKKIIIDSDWKAQAQAEKEKADAEIKAEKEKAQAPPPKADFMSLVSMLATQAYFGLGLIAHPEDKDKTPEPNLELAKYSIDMLAALEEKTKGNLTEEESSMLTGALAQLRMAFVQVSNNVKD